MNLQEFMALGNLEDLSEEKHEELSAYLESVRVGCTHCGKEISLDECTITQAGTPYCHSCYQTHVDPKHHVRDHWRNWKKR